MAAKTLESRFERMSVNDENEHNGTNAYHKPKVRFGDTIATNIQLTNPRAPYQLQCLCQASAQQAQMRTASTCSR